MDGEVYKTLSGVVAEHGYEIEPEPAEGEDLRFFDVVSPDREIATARLLNTIHAQVEARGLAIIPEVMVAQSHRVTFEDLSVDDTQA